jgi:DNA-binding NtrC family response regulator
VEGPDTGQAVDAASDSLTIGTAPGNDLVLHDDTISGYHLEIRNTPDGIVVEDLGSTNGTMLGSVRLERARVPPGTRVAIGRTLLRIEDIGTVDCEVIEADRFGGVLGRSASMRMMLARAERAAKTDFSVLLIGETGTGKEVLAEALHTASSRASAPLEIVDCGTLLPTLTASELFGHEKGAFTGAEQQHIGAFERAHGGTVFLDEIGELPLALQAALLGVLERKSFRRLGGRETIRTDVRVVCATNRDLRAEVNKGTFRQDLYYRIAVMTLQVPPLRDRVDDIPLLIEHFLRDSGSPDRNVFSESVLTTLRGHRWPGNVRELRNFVEVTLGTGELPSLGDVDLSDAPSFQVKLELLGLRAAAPKYREARDNVVREFERIYLADLYERCGGNVAKASRESGMDRNYLTELLDRHGLRKKPR